MQWSVAFHMGFNVYMYQLLNQYYKLMYFTKWEEESFDATCSNNTLLFKNKKKPKRHSSHLLH